MCRTQALAGGPPILLLYLVESSLFADKSRTTHDQGKRNRV